jgi:putative ABC transport system ATP-binding protein
MSESSQQPVVVARALQRIYRVGNADVAALRGVDLEVAHGEFLALVGVSGSGKSTLLHLLGGLDTPSSGQVLVAGHALGQMTSWERARFRRRVVGFVFQSFHLVPHLTAEGNLSLALTFQGVYGSRRRQLARDALHRVGLADRATHRPGQLSGGEQQRVAVARAIIHRPQVLLADEPTGNLDQHTAESLLELLSAIRREAGMTIVMVTHNEDLVTRYCDRKIRIRDGCLEPTDGEPACDSGN